MKRSPKEIYEGEHVEGFRDELELARASSRDAFFGFFNNSESVEDAFEEGVWDFTKHIAEPLTPFLNKITHVRYHENKIRPKNTHC